MERRIAVAIEAALSVEPGELDDAALDDAVLGLARAESRLAAARARLVAVWDGRKVWAADGSKAGSAVLARETGCSVVRAKAEVRRATRLRSMPVTRAAFEAGRLSLDAVDVLCGLNHGRFAPAFARDEAVLVAVAESQHHDDLVRFTRHWRNLADATCDERARKRALDRFFKAAITLDGDSFLQAWLPAVDGAIVRGEVDRLEQELFEADWAEARSRLGDAATEADLRRTADQRRADALVLMARRSAAMAPGSKEGRVLVSILVGYETLHGRICETSDGTVLTPGQVTDQLTDTNPLTSAGRSPDTAAGSAMEQHATGTGTGTSTGHLAGGPLTSAEYERIVFDSPSRVIDVSHRRCFTGALKRAIQIRDRHCTHPGCRVAAERCQIDHIVEHSNGGKTSLENGRLLCPAHNRQRPGRNSPDQPDGP